MKHISVKWLMLPLLAAALHSAAWAENDPLAGISIKDGWMTGTATAHYLKADPRAYEDVIMIDCAEPALDCPADILTVGSRLVSKKQMQQALKAAGQSTMGTFVNPRGEAIYTGDWNAPAHADISKEDAAAHAIQIGLTYFAALGVDVYPVPESLSRPYDFEDFELQNTEYYTHRYSDASSFLSRLKSQWNRRSKFFPKQTEYTTVTFNLMVDGVRLASFASYPAGYSDEPDAWEGSSFGAMVTVSDSGILVEASCKLLEVEKRCPAAGNPVYQALAPALVRIGWPYIAADHWQDALTCALADATLYQLRTNTQDEPYQNMYMDAPVTHYGSKAVITDIYPIFHTISRNEWAPFWIVETKSEYKDGWRTQ